MLVDEAFRYRITDFDQEVFRRFVPPDHPLVAAEHELDWEAFRCRLEVYYSPDEGQPAIDPVRMLKLEFLRYWYNLSDRQVMLRTTTDLAFRYFLQVGYTFRPPHFTSLCYFRARLGEDGFSQIFDELVAQARRAGLVKDRLRAADASHLIASIAVPTTLMLVAQIRDRLLAALEPFDSAWVAGQRIEVNLLRERTQDQSNESRLASRVTHLRELIAWAEELPTPAELETHPGTASAWQRFQETLALARKILFDREHPEAGHKTLSVNDPDARRGKHGEYYDGYLTDILMDPASEIVTQVDVLEAGGDEAGSAVGMVRGEHAAHGNQILALSIDGAGFQGKPLRELEGPAKGPGATASESEAGLGVKVYVSPKSEATSDRFPSTDFTLNEDGTGVSCPAGKSSRYRQRDTGHHATIFRFTRETCDACSLRQQCVAKPETGAFGRSVSKNDYEGEYQRARERAKTDEYAAVHREHLAVERKLNELLNHHGGRRARYRGRPKVRVQQLMTGFVVNTKRILKLLATLRAAGTVKAFLAI